MENILEDFIEYNFYSEGSYLGKVFTYSQETAQLLFFGRRLSEHEILTRDIACIEVIDYEQ